MADRKISDLTALTTPASGDFLPIVDISEAAAATKNKRITVEELMRGMPDGTAAAPGIAFENDPNTGLYSPGADQLAISTNGTGRLFVGNGGVRLNTDTADSVSIFTVNGSSDSTFGIGVNNIYTATSNTFFAYRHLQNGTLLGGLFWQNSTSSLIRYSALNGIAFHTGSGVEGEERLRLDSSGNVGIGTSIPRGQLSIANNLAGTGVVDSTLHFGYSLADYCGFRIVNTSDASATAAGLLRFQRGTTLAWADLLTMDNNGRVGIGTTAPAELLHLSATADPKIQFTDVGNVISKIGISASTALTFEHNGSERARIDSSGNVGIGTSAPGAGLHVQNGGIDTAHFGEGTAGAGINIKTRLNTLPTTGTNANIAWLESGSGFSAGSLLVGSRPGVGRLVFSATGAANMVIDPASGNVGIGTSSPGANHAVHIEGSRKYVAIYPNTGQDAGALGFANPSQSSGLFFGWNRSNGDGESNIVYGTGAGGAPGLQIASWNGTTYTERARIDSSGNVGIGTSSPQLKLDVATLGTYGVIYQPAVNLRNTSSGGTATSPTGLGAINWNVDGLYDVANIEAVRENPSSGTFSSLVFRTNPTNISTGAGTERMRITNGGNVLFNATAVVEQGLVLISYNGGVNQGAIFAESDTTSGNTAIRFKVAGSTVGSITTTSAATAYNTSSDYRIKENVTAVTDGITRLQQLKPSRFNFIADPDHAVDGFIAHEVQDIVPEAITGEKDAVDDEGNPVYQGIDQSKMVPLVVAALQECIRKVEALESELALLKSKP